MDANIIDITAYLSSHLLVVTLDNGREVKKIIANNSKNPLIFSMDANLSLYCLLV